MSTFKTLIHLYSNSFMEFLKDPSLVLYSSSYTPLSTVVSNSAADHHLCAADTSLFYHSQLWISLITSLALKTLTNVSIWMSSILKTLNLLYFNFFVEFLNDPSLFLYSSSYAPLLSVVSYLIQKPTITSMLMKLNFSYHSHLWISLITSLTLKTL